MCKILAIEDSELHRKLITKLFDKVNQQENDINAEVTCVGTLEEGKAELSATPCRYEAVILDLSLPDSKGLNTYLSIKSYCHGIPVIIFTADEDFNLGMSCVAAGAELVLDKADARMLPRMVLYAVEKMRYMQDVMMKNELLSSIFCNSPLWLLVVNADLQLVMASCSVNMSLKQWGYPEAHVGQYIWEALPFIEKDVLIAHYEKIFETGEEINMECEWNITTKGGRSFVLHAQCAKKPIKLGKEVTYVLTIAVDVTQHYEQRERFENLLARKAREVSHESAELMTATRKILLESAHQLGLAKAERLAWESGTATETATKAS